MGVVRVCKYDECEWWEQAVGRAVLSLADARWRLCAHVRRSATPSAARSPPELHFWPLLQCREWGIPCAL